MPQPVTKMIADEETLPALLRSFVQQGPEQPFLADGLSQSGGSTIRRGDLARMVQELGIRYRGAGVGAGDRVAIYLERGTWQAAAFLAASEVGAIAVCLNEKLKDRQVQHILADSEPGLVVSSRTKLGLLLRPEQVLADRAPLLVDDPGPLPSVEDIQAVEVRPEDPATILYTSGSTGLAKGVVQTHKNLVRGATTVRDYLGLESTDHLLGVLPLSFDYGLNQLLAALATGCRLTLLSYLGMAEVVAAISRGITVLAGVPPMWHGLAAWLDAHPEDADCCACLRILTSSGGRLPDPLVAALRRHLPAARVFRMYGLTEAFRSSYLPPELLDQRPESIGRAIAGVQLLVVDSQGEPCAPGEVGELVHAGDLVAAGYWKRPQDTARMFRPHPQDPDGGTVVFTGDLVRQDADGYLYFVERADRQLKVSGFRVSPTEVEQVVMEVAGVLQAAVVGMPDPTLGEQIAVFVTTPEAPDEIIRQVLRVCRRELPSYMQPAAVHVVARMPLSPNGKVDSQALAAML